VGGVALGFCDIKNVEGLYSDCVTGTIETLVSLGNDELQFNRLDKVFKIYIGSHGDKGANCADVILPTAAYSETDGLYLNAEGRVREAIRSVFPVGEAKETWAIFRALSELMGQTLPFDNFAQVREGMFKTYAEFRMIDQIISSDFTVIKSEKPCTQSVYRTTIKDFYYTDAITRASKVLRECQKAVDDKAININQTQVA
jgi:NADH-quinone oxidoreductase subunit G